MIMRSAATKRRVTLAVVPAATSPAAPIRVYDKRLTDTLALLRGHVTFWQQREQLPALDDYLDKVAARKTTGSLPQYKEFSGAVRMAAVILCARPAAAVALPDPHPVQEMWRCAECGRMFDEAETEHECVPSLPVAAIEPETGAWKLLDRTAAPAEASDADAAPDTTPGFRSPVAEGWDDPAPADVPGPDTDPDPRPGPGAQPEDEPHEPALDEATS